MAFCRGWAQDRTTLGIFAALGVALLLISTTRTAIAVSDTPSASNPPITQCMQNLVQSISTPQALRFKETVQRPWGSEVRDVIRTKEGRVDRLMTRRGERLSESQQEKELARLRVLLHTGTVKPESLRQQDGRMPVEGSRMRVTRANLAMLSGIVHTYEQHGR